MEAPEGAVVLELADIVDGEEVGALDELGADERVEVDRKREPLVAERLALSTGLGRSTIGAAVTTTSAPATASSGVAAGSASSSSTRSGCGSHARIRTPGFVSRRRRAWKRPCSPQPRIVAVAHPARAKRRTHAPLAAAVRAAVISAPSMIATTSPVSASFTTIRPERYGRTLALFARYPATHLSATTSLRSRYTGIACTSESGRGWTPGFEGSSTRPAARSRYVSSTRSSCSSSGGSRSATSFRVR